MSCQNVTSERGNVNGFTFSPKKVLKSGETFWTYSKKMCNAIIFTVCKEYIISRRNEIHNREENLAKLNAQILNTGVKRKPMDYISERLSKLKRKR
jgi:hypothetical protein